MLIDLLSYVCSGENLPAHLQTVLGKSFSLSYVGQGQLYSDQNPSRRIGSSLCRVSRVQARRLVATVSCLRKRWEVFLSRPSLRVGVFDHHGRWESSFEAVSCLCERSRIFLGTILQGGTGVLGSAWMMNLLQPGVSLYALELFFER